MRVIPNGLSLAGVYVAILPIPFHTEWRVFVEAGKVAAQLSGMKAVGVGFGFPKAYILKLLSSNSAVLKLNEESLVFDVDRFLEGMDFPIKTNVTSVCCDSGRLVIECGQQVSW